MGGVKRKWPIPREGTVGEGRKIFEKYHSYKGSGNIGKIFVTEAGGGIIAAWAWQPPPVGAAKAVSPSCVSGVLALSRMAAIPKTERDWHISKPLRWIMLHGLDRGRWPVLVTYADLGEGHTGHVYKCSGWQEDGTRESRRYLDEEGCRRSPYSNGAKRGNKLVSVGKTKIIRFVHRVCPKGEELKHMLKHGWVRVPTGRVWKSGNPAMTWKMRAGS